MKKFHLHLVSDATGETINGIARAAVSQYEGVEATEHMWAMVRTKRQVDQVIDGVAAHPGVVLFTLVDASLRKRLEVGCAPLKVPTVRVLEPVLATLGSYLGLKSRGQPGRQHALDGEYFGRIDAMHFVLDHDDGQLLEDLERADVLLVGPSRTSKTPTCFYLANRGIKAANVPIVPGYALPFEANTIKTPLVIGLVVSPDRLLEVRRNRLRWLGEDRETDYVDVGCIRDEIIAARRVYTANHWPTIDVTRRSIEEVAAAILQLHARRRGGDDFVDPSVDGLDDGAPS